MDTIEIIVECSFSDYHESQINKIGKIKYFLPIIDSYVVEIPKEKFSLLENMENIVQINSISKITAQIDNAKEAININEAQGEGLTGKGVTVAILDTGISPVNDFTKPYNRIIGFKDFVNDIKTPYDDNGHGTHVAGICCGNGFNSSGKYKGIAPNAFIIGVKILDKDGSGNSADVLAGIQWIVDNKDKYNIKVANLSVGATEVVGKDPLVRAVEAAWDKGIILTVAAGNNGPNKGTITSPGVSRKVITVGASDDCNTNW